MKKIAIAVVFLMLFALPALAQTQTKPSTFPFVPLQAGWDTLVQVSASAAGSYGNLLTFYSKGAPNGLLNVGIQEVNIKGKSIGAKTVSYNFGFDLNVDQTRQFLITDETGISPGWMLNFGTADIAVFWVKNRTQIKAMPAQMVYPNLSLGIQGSYGPDTGLALLSLGTGTNTVTVQLEKDGKVFTSTTINMQNLDQKALYLGQLFPGLAYDVYTVVFKSTGTLALDMVNFD